jgi:5'-nucleotidase
LFVRHTVIFSQSQGNFTIDDGYSLLPFKETIVNIFMTSKQIKNVLEDAIDFFLVDAASRGAYPRASGLRFDVTLH